MKKIYVLNYSENTYQKERVRKSVEGLDGRIINRFSQRPFNKSDKRRQEIALHISNGDIDLMQSADELWVIVGHRKFFGLYKRGELFARRSGIKIRYFSLCHQGPYQCSFKEVERSYFEE